MFEVLLQVIEDLLGDVIGQCQMIASQRGEERMHVVTDLLVGCNECCRDKVDRSTKNSE